jgi:dienelactone hydrolase
VRPRILLPGLVALALLVPVGGCEAAPKAGAAAPSARPTATASEAPLPALPSRAAPAAPFAVGIRQVDLARGPDRPLPTTVWYPAQGTAGGAARSGAAPAGGRFPLVLLSHGLTGLPSYLAPIGTRWAAAGFVVAAPAYPHTKHGAPQFAVSDVANQPADASYVITEVLASDPAHIDPAAIAAAGHSAGGYTTTGLLSSHRDPRLRAAVVIAGALLGGAYTGRPTPVLFVHGDADQTVSYPNGGRPAYAALPWPKAFLTLEGGDHGRYLSPGNRGFDQMIATTTDFLRWALYGDPAARDRLPRDAAAPGVTRWESAL